jgi:hypothetical protein
MLHGADAALLAFESTYASVRNEIYPQLLQYVP